MIRHCVTFSMFFAVACDVAVEGGDPAPLLSTSPATSMQPLEPRAPTQASPPSDQPRTAPARPEVALASARDREALRAQAEATAAANFAAVVGIAVEATHAVVTQADEPAMPTPEHEPASATRTISAVPTKSKPGGGRAPTTNAPCDATTFAWGNIRVPTWDGTARLKGGSRDTFAKGEGCHSLRMVGPAFGDLDRDGRNEAYFVINELYAPPDLVDDEDAMCTYSMIMTDETLYGYRLDEHCRPVPMGDGISTGSCPESEECATLELRLRGNQIIYGADRFIWSAGKLIRAR